jgi:hypothetical protein
MDDRRDEKLVFKLISKMSSVDLKTHIFLTQDKYDITKIYDRSGYSPLHFAAYKNSEKICEVLIEFIMVRENNRMQYQSIEERDM